MFHVKYVSVHENAKAPHCASTGAAGHDLYSVEQVNILPGQRALISTGIKMQIPSGYFGNIRDRSGLAWKHGLHTLAGVIDSDYTGVVKVVLMNLSDTPYTVSVGERIAQIIFQQCEATTFVQVTDLDDTLRNAGGFGSTGST